MAEVYVDTAIAQLAWLPLWPVFVWLGLMLMAEAVLSWVI